MNPHPVTNPLSPFSCWAIDTGILICLSVHLKTEKSWMCSPSGSYNFLFSSAHWHLGLEFVSANSISCEWTSWCWDRGKAHMCKPRRQSLKLGWWSIHHGNDLLGVSQWTDNPLLLMILSLDFEMSIDVTQWEQRQFGFPNVAPSQTKLTRKQTSFTSNVREMTDEKLLSQAKKRKNLQWASPATFPGVSKDQSSHEEILLTY